jgi:hypothetical protein
MPSASAWRALASSRCPVHSPGAHAMKHYLKLVVIVLITVIVAKRVPVLKDWM